MFTGVTEGPTELSVKLGNWAKSSGEAEDYRDNLSSQCIHPVGHWYEIPNLLLHNIDTLGANADPAVLGYHIQQQKAMTVELITRKLDDRGGGLAKINGQIRLVEGLALPDEKEASNSKTYLNWTVGYEMVQKITLTQFANGINNLQLRYGSTI